MARTLRLREKPRRRPRLKVESLEDRSVPATDITVASDVFTVSNGADESIALTLNKVGDDYILQVVGSTFNLPVLIGGVSLSDGDQTLTVDTDDVDVVAWSFLLGNLADSLTVGVGTVNGFAPVTVAGGVGAGETDQLTIDDSANDAAHDYTVTASTVKRVGGITVNYAQMEQVTLTAGSEDDTVHVQATADGTPVIVNAGTGNDTINVGSQSNSLVNVLGAVTVNGDLLPSDDRLNVNDQGNSNPTKYIVTATTIDRFGAGKITYSSIDSLVISTSTAADTIAVDSTAADTDATINAGTGNDTITAGNDTITVGGGSLDDLAGDVTLRAGSGNDLLRIDDSADADDNTYTVTASTISRTNGTAESFDYDQGNFDRLILTAGTGNDTITISATDDDVTINGGSGNDTLTVAGLDDIDSVVTFSGDEGTADALNVDDSGDGEGHKYTVTATQVIRTNGTVTFHDAAELLTVSTGGGNDEVNVTTTETGTPVVVNGGTGNDTFTVGTVLDPSLDNIRSAVTLNGDGQADGGADRLTVRDHGEDVPRTYTLTDLSVAWGGPGSINYATVERVVLNASTGADTIEVNAVAAGTNVTIEGGAGGDTISVGGGSLDNVAGGLTLNPGDTAGDVLIVDDSADETDNTYTVTDESVERTNDLDVTFDYEDDDFERLVLAAGKGADTITISATASGIPVTINGGAGDDLITIGRLDDIDAPVTLNGGGGTADALTVNDSDDGAGETYTVTATKVTRTSWPATITYATAEAMTLRTGGGVDTVNVEATAAGTVVAVQTEGGNDTVNAGADGLLTGLAGELIVNTGDGTNVLNLNDQGFSDPTTYTVTADKVERAGAKVSYIGPIAQIRLNTGSAANTINVESTANNSPVTVTGGSGADTFTVGAGSLDDLRAALTLNAGAVASDNLRVNDSTDTSNNNYTVSATSIGRTGAAAIAYSQFDTLEVSAGSGKNSIVVSSTSTATTTVTGGTDIDKFNVNGPGLSVNSQNEFFGGNELGVDGDEFTVSPIPTSPSPPTTAITINGDGATPATIDTLFAKLTNPLDPTPVFVSGKIKFGTAYLDVDYASIESTGLDTPVITLDGTDFNDTLTITAISATEGAYVVGATGNQFRNVELFKWEAGDGNDTVVINNPSAGVFAPATRMEIVSTDQLADVVRILGGTATSGTYEIGATGVRVTHETLDGTLTIVAPTGTTIEDTVTEERFTAYATDVADTIVVTDQPGAAGAATRVSIGVGPAPTTLDVRGKTVLAVRGGDLVVGGDAADTIEVNLTDAVGGAARVDVFGDGGDDTISILTIPVDRTYSVDGGDANDAITIGQDGTLDAILGVGSVIGGTGLDTLTVDDSADGEANAYTLTAPPITTLVRGGAGAITYGTLEALIVRAGDGDDNVAIGAGTLDSILGAVNVDGGDGRDLVAVNDSTDDSDNSYSINATSVSRTNGPVVTVDFARVEQVTFAAGAGDDSIDIQAIALNTELTASAGAGSDAVSVGGGSLDNLLGALTLDADLGTDTLTVDNTDDADNNNSYSITDTRVERLNTTAFDDFAYLAQGFERLVLSAGNGNDTVAIESTADNTPVSVLGGGGNDMVIAGTGGTLNTLLAPVDIDGVAGDDQLTVNDSADATGNIYTVTSSRVSRTTGNVVIDYADIEQINLATGSGNDTVSIPSTAADTQVSIDAGPGDDIMTVGAGSLDSVLGALALDGGTGPDNRLVVDDSTDSTDNTYSILPASVSRTNGTPVSIPYTTRFRHVLLQAGARNDSIAANSSPAPILVSADGGEGNDTFTLEFLSGSILGGAGDNTILGDNGARTYTLTGANAGTISAILGGSFAAIDNLVAGSADDTFTLNNGGSLSGEAFGGAGIDTLNGNDNGSKFTLAGANSGSVSNLANAVLVGSFTGLELINGGIGDDTLIIDPAVPANGLRRFDGGAGDDTVDLSDPEREVAQQVVIEARGAVDGFNITGGTATSGSTTPIVTLGFDNINRLLGSSTAKTDSLTGLAGQPADWDIFRHANADDSYAQADRSLTFEHFDQLVGRGAQDEFRVNFSVADAATTPLLIRGGGLNGDGVEDIVSLIGGAAVRPDKLTVLPRVHTWPATITGQSVFAALKFNSGQPVLYDDNVETLDLQGGDGDDTFLVDPGKRGTPKAKAIPLYGMGVRKLTLQGQAGNDTFYVVPDRFTSNGKNPKVAIFVYGGAASEPPAPGASEEDRMTLYRLPARYKANFPVEGKKGPPNHTFDLGHLNFAPVHYRNMWTVKAEIVAPPQV